MNTKKLCYVNIELKNGHAYGLGNVTRLEALGFVLGYFFLGEWYLKKVVGD